MCKRSMVILLLVFTAGLFTFRSAEAVSSDVSDSVEKVSIDVLVNAYESNPFKAQKTYTGKTLEVSGQIARISSEKNHPVITLHNGRGIWVCFHIVSDDQLLLEVVKGGNATLRGYVSKVDVNDVSEAYTLTDGKIISAQ